MNKLTEFRPSEESSIVPRILLTVHQAIDQDFPSSVPVSKRFAKTDFSINDEPTINQTLPHDVGPSDSFNRSPREPKTKLQKAQDKLLDFFDQTKNKVIMTILGIVALTALIFIISMIY